MWSASLYMCCVVTACVTNRITYERVCYYCTRIYLIVRAFVSSSYSAAAEMKHADRTHSAMMLMASYDLFETSRHLGESWPAVPHHADTVETC